MKISTYIINTIHLTSIDILYLGGMQVTLSEEIDLVSQVQNLDEAVCISFHTNSLGNGMNPFVLSPDIRTWVYCKVDLAL